MADSADLSLQSESPRQDVTRRHAVGSMLQTALVVHPMSGRLLALIGPSLALGEATELQPLLAEVRRLVDAMAYLGQPFSDDEVASINAAAILGDERRAVNAIQHVLDPHCLLTIRINPESRVSVERGAAPARLIEQGWRAFLLKVRNEAGATAALRIDSPQARPVYRPGTGNSIAPKSVSPADVADRWLVVQTFDDKPMEPRLSGLDLEYRIVLLYSRDRGRREAQLGASLGDATQDIGFRNRAAVLFDIAPSRDIILHVRDENGQPTTASFVVKDKVGHVYPARSKRLAPDFRTRSIAPTAKASVCRRASSR
jgi:hypothetical protein